MPLLDSAVLLEVFVNEELLELDELDLGLLELLLELVVVGRTAKTTKPAVDGAEVVVTKYWSEFELGGAKEELVDHAAVTPFCSCHRHPGDRFRHSIRRDCHCRACYIAPIHQLQVRLRL